MLERRHRLTSSVGFSAATRSGRRAGTRHLVVHLTSPVAGSLGSEPGLVPQTPPAPSGDTVDPRVGFVVSRAVGDAVTRNRVKRRLRHQVRTRLDRLPPAAVLVVRALPSAADASSTVLGRDLDHALQRLARPMAAAGSRVR